MGGLVARMPGMGLVVAGYKDVEGVYIGYGRGGGGHRKRLWGEGALKGCNRAIFLLTPFVLFQEDALSLCTYTCA